MNPTNNTQQQPNVAPPAPQTPGMPNFNAPQIAGNWNPGSVQDYVKSYGGQWTPQIAAQLFQQQGLGTAQQYLSAGANNAAYNSALLAKLKGYSGTTGTGISGSGAVGQGIQTNNAMASATNSIVPQQQQQTTQQPAGTTPPTPPPTDTTTAPTDYLSQVEKQQQENIDLVTNQANQQTQALQTQFAQAYGDLQREKTNALAGAAAAYDAAHTTSIGTDRQAYLDTIAKHYDTQLQNMQNTFNTQNMAIQQNLQQSIQSVKTQFQNAQQDYRKEKSAEYRDSLKTLTAGDGSPLTTDETVALIEAGIASGKSFNLVKLDIQEALDKAKATTRKQDAQIRRMEILDAKVLASLNKGSGDDDKILSPTEIKNLNEQYEGKVKFDYGMTKADAITTIQNKPTYQLPKVYITTSWDKAGIYAKDREQIRDALKKGYTVDEVISSIKGITPDQEKLLRNNIKPL